METVDFFSPQFVENPYETLHRVRENSPVCKVAPIGYWGLSRYNDVVEALSNPSLFSSKAMTDPNAVFPEIRRFLETEALVAMDPPSHGKLRSVISRAFSVRNINSLEDRIRSVCRGLLNRIPDPSRFDLISEFALPLPVTVICELLGVDFESRTDFKRWSDGILRTLPVTSMPEGPEKEQAKKEVEACYREFEQFLLKLMDERRARPREDLISVLVSASGEERITTQDVISLSRLLLIAGSETTTNLIALAMRILVRNKEVLTMLRQDRSLIPAFIEEALRFDGPTMAVLRLLTEEVHMHGVTMKKGDRVALFLSAANRDGSQYPNPDQFDMTRSTAHLAFGKANHFCIGASLARMEVKLTLEAMLERFSDFSLGDKGFGHSTLILQVFRHFDLQTRPV